MRRVMLLALLTLALPMAALASSIDPQVGYNTGVPADQANASMAALGNPFTVDVICPSCNPVVGQISPVKMNLVTSTLDCIVSSFCTFSDGTATVNSLTGVQLFTDNLSNGTIIIGSESVVISAELVPTGNVTSGEVNFGLSFTGNQLTAGNGSMLVNTVVPEPGTLGLLGTGLIGLGGMARRKLRPQRLWRHFQQHLTSLTGARRIL